MESAELPAGWADCRLGELGRWSGGGTPSKSNSAFWTGGTIPWVSPKDMKADHIRGAEDSITEAAVRSSAAKHIPVGSILMVTRSGILSHTFPVGINDYEVTVNQDLKTLSPTDGVDPRYVAWFLRSNNRRILTECAKHGTTVASIDTERLKSLTVHLAPTAEQQRIVEKIETLFAQLDKGEEALREVQTLLARYRQSVLKAAVTGELTADWRAANGPPEEGGEELLAHILKQRRETWRGRGKYKEPLEPDTGGLPSLPERWTWATIDQLANTVEYGSSAKCSADSDGVPVLRMGNIVDGELDFSSLKFLPSDHDEFPKLFLSNGDLVFNRTNSAELVGKTAVYKGQRNACSFASYLIRVRLTETSPDFVAAYINSLYGRAWVKSVVSQQVGQANVNGTKLKALAVPLPPKDEQLAIVELLEDTFARMSKASAWCKAELKRSTALRQSILKDAFSGKLVPQDPSDEAAEKLLARIRARSSKSKPTRKKDLA